MPRTSLALRSSIVRRAVFGNKSAHQIWKDLKNEGVFLALNTVKNIIFRFIKRGVICDKIPASRRRRKIGPAQIRRIDELSESNDELTSTDIAKILKREFNQTHAVSAIRTARLRLGWICSGTRYAQCIRQKNRFLRMIYVRKLCMEKETFSNVIFTDECTVELDNHARISFRRKGDKPRLKGKPKHPYKLHVWAGVSMRGATDIVLFEGIMKKEFYVDILRTTLIPFGQMVYPDGYRLMQDNDPKHTSVFARDFMEANNINWWKTPPESPDLNPIEKVWHEMKHYLRKESKPTSKEELVNGILTFWKERITPEKCRRYIYNLRKAIPLVARNKGRATGL